VNEENGKGETHGRLVLCFGAVVLVLVFVLDVGSARGRVGVRRGRWGKVVRMGVGVRSVRG
jgi:hypothetical protein